MPAAHPDHRDARAPHQHLAQAVLDVEPLELDRLSVDRPEVDAVVGEHAVHVEPEEADASREPRVNHAREPRGRACGRPARRAGRAATGWPRRSRRRAGSGWVSRKKPSAPATAAAASSAGMCSRWPPLAPPVPCPGCCTAWVASNITGAPVAAAQAARSCACPRPGRRSRRRCPARSPPRRRSPPIRTFSTAPAMASACIHWPFFTFTGRPVRPAATSRSVCRQRNAGIWSASATSAAPAACAGSWMSVRIGQPARRAHPLEHSQPFLEARARAARRARARLALSKLALKQTGDAARGADARQRLRRPAAARRPARPRRAPR